MNNIWTAFKNLFVRKNADADSRKDKDSGHNEYQKAQRKPHTYDEIDIKEKDQTTARKPHPYDSIDVDNGKVSVPADSSKNQLDDVIGSHIGRQLIDFMSGVENE